MQTEFPVKWTPKVIGKIQPKTKIPQLQKDERKNDSVVGFGLLLGVERSWNYFWFREVTSSSPEISQEKDTSFFLVLEKVYSWKGKL